MKIDVHSYSESFIHEDEVLVNARTRGAEVGAHCGYHGADQPQA